MTYVRHGQFLVQTDLDLVDLGSAEAQVANKQHHLENNNHW